MQTKKFGNKIFLRIDKGEEIVSSLKKCCQEFNIVLGTVTGLGAASEATIGLYNVGEKKYYSQKFQGDFEIAPLYGNITTMNGETYLHLHINLGDEKHNSYSGHLNEAVVGATFEGVIEIIDGRIERKLDNAIGLNVLDI